jgi:hypothetical protein
MVLLQLIFWMLLLLFLSWIRSLSGMIVGMSADNNLYSLLTFSILFAQISACSYYSGVWCSDFAEIFDVDWFISFLSKDVTIIKQLPTKGGKVLIPYRTRAPRKCTPICYLTKVLPVLNKKHVSFLLKVQLENRVSLNSMFSFFFSLNDCTRCNLIIWKALTGNKFITLTFLVLFSRLMKKVEYGYKSLTYEFNSFNVASAIDARGIWYVKLTKTYLYNELYYG